MSIQNLWFRSCVSVILLFSVAGISSCGSKTKAPTPAAPNTPSVDLTKPESAPGVQTFTERDIDGKAFAIDGGPVKARSLITNGENRRPVFSGPTSIAFASRRASLQRWQVFEADLSKNIERRISFDAGDAEPVVALGDRLIISSSSDEKKSGERVLNRYQEVFVTKEAPVAATTSKPTVDITAEPTSLQQLMLEHPARGRKGTEWNRISHTAANRWIFSADRDLKLGLAIMISPGKTQAFRVSINSKSREPETRVWTEMKVEVPAAPGASAPAKDAAPVASFIDGKIFPDGTRILWSNGSILWSTNLKGGDPLRIGDDTTPELKSLSFDPSGQWIIFASSSAARGLNLMALHKSGRCLKTLTDLVGDETEPVFSPDGQWLVFSYADEGSKQGHSSVIAKIPFGSQASVQAGCP